MSRVSIEYVKKTAFRTQQKWSNDDVINEFKTWDFMCYPIEEPNFEYNDYFPIDKLRLYSPAKVAINDVILTLYGNYCTHKSQYTISSFISLSFRVGIYEHMANLSITAPLSANKSVCDFSIYPDLKSYVTYEEVKDLELIMDYQGDDYSFDADEINPYNGVSYDGHIKNYRYIYKNYEWRNGWNLTNIKSKLEDIYQRVLQYFINKTNPSSNIHMHMRNLYTKCIDMLIPELTKTYTNSTWDTQKTWYIKITFSSSSSCNVVNYDTIYVTKRIYMEILIYTSLYLLYYYLLKS